MYERFYNLRERPFSLSPDPDYLYPSRVHREALGYLRYGIEGHAGFVVITGEIGCGKTTLLQTMLRGLDRQTAVSRLVNTMLDARELVEAVMLDFGLDPGQGRSKPYLLRDLARFLVDQRMAGRLALLVIDEAQNLSLTRSCSSASRPSGISLPGPSSNSSGSASRSAITLNRSTSTRLPRMSITGFGAPRSARRSSGRAT
ncbi:MAG: hypothetical protein DMG01_29430 [Acidobacteria bacterium]|nr:MAG: hypothetical protein DMG01_29430 [Acidobacteriota bacterium]